MLREEQIDLRRRRAQAEGLRVEKLGKKKLHTQYRVTNPTTGGDYTVTLRGFAVGDNECTCPDFKANTLGTCKHVEAVLAQVEPQTPAHLRKRKAAVTRPEVHLRYGEQVDLEILLPPRRSDPLAQLAKTYFDAQGRWKAGERYDEFVNAVDTVPEAVSVTDEALEFIDTVTDRRKLREREAEWLAELETGAIPEALQDLVSVPLYDYQLRGAVFAACRARAILGDDMGLGKTVQAIAAVELLARERHITKVLVVAPASVKYQWELEVRKFSGRPVQVIDGDKPDRIEQYARPTFYRLVNYEQVTRDLDELNDWKPDLVILDEAQRIKNWESKTSRAVKRLQSRYALVLTGTPLENKLEELYSIVQFIDDRRLGPAFQFLHDHRELDDDGRLIGYRQLEAIRTKLAPVFLRRRRDEVLTQLPERTEQTVYVELSDAQRGPYEEQRAALGRLLAKPALSDIDRKRVLACLTNLRLICNSTALFDPNTSVSPKLDEFADLIRELTAEDATRKVVVFSQWELMQEQAAAVLDLLGVSYVRLYGRLPAADRKPVIEKFQTDPSCRVFLSTDAGGTGLNLQAADTVIHLEVPWNPAVLEQRTARVHRLGQQRPVTVIRLVTRDSIEERVLSVLEQKRELFAGLFDGDGDEINFAGSVQAEGFVAALRQELIPAAPATREKAAPTAENRLLTAGVAMMEALADVLTAQTVTSDPTLAERVRAAWAKLGAALGEDL